MSERAKVKGERIAFTIDKSTFEQLDKILYMQRKSLKEVLTPMVQTYIEQNKNEIKRYDKTFNIETTTVPDKPPTATAKTNDTIPAVLTPAQRTEAVNIICKFIIDNDSHFYIKGNDSIVVKQPVYGIKTTDYIAVEKEPLKELFKSAGLDARAIFSALKVQINFQDKVSYRMVKVTSDELETYQYNTVAANGTTEIDGADRNDDEKYS